MLTLSKDGDRMQIYTDAKTESELTTQMAQALEALIDSGRHTGDWQFQLGFWLPYYVELICALRGYKTTVRQQTLWISGDNTVVAKDIQVTVAQGRVVIPGQPDQEVSDTTCFVGGVMQS